MKIPANIMKYAVKKAPQQNIFCLNDLRKDRRTSKQKFLVSIVFASFPTLSIKSCW